MAETAAEDDREAARKRYESILRAVEYNTGNGQPPGIRPATLIGLRSHADDTPREARSAIQAAYRNDDLVRWRDDEGAVRITRCTEPGLIELIETEAEREHPDRELIAAANQALAEVRDDG